MAEGKADELRKLAALRDDGIITEKEFGEQKRRLLRSDPGASWLVRGQTKWSLIPAGLIVLLVAGLLVFVRPGSGSSTPVVRLQETAASSSEIQNAITYAQKYAGTNTDEGLCLQFVYEAWKSAGVDIGGYFPSDTALLYWTNDPMGWVKHASSNPPAYPNSPPPAGALVFWGNNKWVSDGGHVALSLGGGSVVSTSAYPYAGLKGVYSPNVFDFSLTKRPAAEYNYLGYIMPLETPPTPTPTPIQVQPAGSGSQVQPAGAGSSLQPASGSTSGNLTTPTPQKASTPTLSTPTPSTPTPSTPTPSTPTPSTPTPSTPTPSTPTPAPQTYAETVGGVTHTWTDYGNAGGSQGATINTGTTVQITCRVTGFKVTDGNTWWYEIASSPWNNTYYASADAFYNNGDTSGSLIGTPFVDTRVPVC